MRIGMMADVYKPHVSGVTNYIALNKAHLEQMGYQAYVFTFSAGDYIDDEINIIRSRSLPLLDTGYYFSLRYTRSARRLLQTMDVVHVMTRCRLARRRHQSAWNEPPRSEPERTP